MFCYEGIAIRAVEARDLESIRKFRNDPSTWMMLTDISLLDAEDQREWFARLHALKDRKYYVLCDDSHPFLGLVRTDQIDLTNRSIRVGVDIACELRGQGYGRKAYRLLKKYCFDYLNMHRVWLLVLDTNERALRLYEQQGFTLEGRHREAIFRDGSYHDYLILSILKQEYNGQNEKR